jgi:hypothetical protein
MTQRMGKLTPKTSKFPMHGGCRFQPHTFSPFQPLLASAVYQWVGGFIRVPKARSDIGGTYEIPPDTVAVFERSADVACTSEYALMFHARMNTL